MDILVLFGEIAYISSRAALQGIVEGARADGNNIFLFTCEGFLFHDLPKYSKGEYEIFRLPDLNNYSGVIVNYNSIRNEETREYLRHAIAQSGIPCVSFEEADEHSCRIDFTEEKAMEAMLEHLIVDHGYTDIHYISGPMGNEHSHRRLRVYEETLRKHGLEVSADNIHYGDFNFGSGKRIVAHYIDTRRQIPQVFVAANDYMAIGAMEELELNGYHCPEDVAVVGIDNSEVGQKMSPRLTTVDVGVTEAGYRAYSVLMEMIEGHQVSKEILVEGKPIIGRSCGCTVFQCDHTETTEYVELNIQTAESLDLIKALSIHLADVKNLVEFEKQVTPLISRMAVDNFYYCQCGSRESYYQELEAIAKGEQEERTTYGDTVWCPIAYEKGAWSSYPAYDTKMLLPPNCKKDDGNYYIVMPVHRDGECLGYCVIANLNNDLSGRVLQHLVLALDKALGGIRNHDIHKTMLAHINKKWQYDELTSLYNRSGLYHRFPEFLKLCKKRKKGVAVYFFDLDGLKCVNDSKGHKEGDDYICEMAKVLSENAVDQDIAVRFGGDEFLFVTIADSEEDSLKKGELLAAAVNEVVSSSVGSAYGKIENNNQLNLLIEQADKSMYADKTLRKAGR